MSALLPIRIVEKPWGRTRLPPPFAAPEGQRIGEIWFEPPPALDEVLVKYIFTSERLSVQVHPPGGAGKEECWLVLDAEPDARLAIGFREEIGADAMRAAALDGTIVDLLEWHPAAAGDFFYIPAGTVHAIGAGVSLVEVQRNRDVTYRLYDYGRPRELHLDEGLAVASGASYDPALHRRLPARGSVTLVEGPWFRLDRVDGPPFPDIAAHYPGALQVIPLDGMVAVAGEAVAPGECAAAVDLAQVAVAEGAVCLLARGCGKSA